jgi:hypothetical protein
MVPAVISLVALVIALIAGILTWFVISGSQFSLLYDGYHAMYVYIAQGSGALQASSALGALLYNSSTSNAIVLVAFAIILFFWPAMLVSGAFNLIVRSYGPYPFVWGTVAFIFAYIMMHYGSGTLGVGAYLDLVAAILFLVAWITVRRAPAARPQPAPRYQQTP